MSKCAICGAPKREFISHTPKNPGRRFAKCTRCNTGFEWLDNPTSAVPEAQAQVSVQGAANTRTSEIALGAGDFPSFFPSLAPTPRSNGANTQAVTPGQPLDALLEPDDAPVVPERKFAPSRYQTAIYSFLEQGQGNAVVMAGPGSGKTTTLKHAAPYLPARAKVAAIAFNRRNARDLEKVMPEWVRASTFHSLGLANIRRNFRSVQVDERKVYRILNDLANESYIYRNVIGEDASIINQLVSLCKNTLTLPDPVSLARLADHYGVAVNGQAEAVYEIAGKAFDQSQHNLNTVDFDDMIYLPAIGHVACEPFDFLLIDETQDLNKAQIEFALHSTGKNSRVLAVGDRKQCHPAGTIVAMEGGYLKPIEAITEGDKVVSYYTQKSVFKGNHTQGRKVLATAHRNYIGNLIRITAGENTVEVTPNHRCLVKMAPKNYVFLYLMIKGDFARIGITRGRSHGNNGVSLRARQEGADKAWILAIFEDRREAKINEILAQAKFGLPGAIFNQPAGELLGSPQEFFDEVYSRIGPNLDRARECLRYFGREWDYPIWEKGKSNFHMATNKAFITQASNVISGYMRVRTYDGTLRGGKWEVVETSTRWFEGNVYSLSVEPTEGGKRLYVANNIVVGNSIYGFRGAALDAVDNVIAALSATTLPLSITYRMPQLHVNYVNSRFPHEPIEAREGAPDGVIDTVAHDAMLSRLIDGDMVICRCNAPLVAPCFELIRRGVKATIAGRDIGKGLVALLEKVQKRSGATSLSALLSALMNYAESEAAKLIAAHKGTQAQSLMDSAETLIALADGCNVVSEVTFKINGVFSDEAQGVTFSSVHRAKGLEADNVYLLKPDLIPHKMATQSWEIAQELNILYVSLTRSRHGLYFVS